MSRAQRLLTLLQVLRRYRFPVAGAVLAQELDISLRTLYRDIGTLKEQGADIEGEAGMGFLLRPGFMLPPLMFGDDEIEALVLGARWVASRADDELGKAARSALDKIAAVLPPELRHELDASALLVPPNGLPVITPMISPQVIRQAIRCEHKAEIYYQDVKDTQTARTIWPFALAYFDGVQLLVAWCELREGFRHFRVDRIHELNISPERYPRRRQALLKAWQESQGIDSL